MSFGDASTVLVEPNSRPVDIRPLPLVIHREYVTYEQLAKMRETYVVGRDACFFENMPIKRMFPSNFRVNWRMLNVDGFHRKLLFEYTPVKYEFKTGVGPARVEGWED
jgi:hypothetical protein